MRHRAAPLVDVSLDPEQLLENHAVEVCVVRCDGVGFADYPLEFGRHRAKQKVMHEDRPVVLRPRCQQGGCAAEVNFSPAADRYGAVGLEV